MQQRTTRYVTRERGLRNGAPLLCTREEPATEAIMNVYQCLSETDMGETECLVELAASCNIFKMKAKIRIIPYLPPSAQARFT